MFSQFLMAAQSSRESRVISKLSDRMPASAMLCEPTGTRKTFNNLCGDRRLRQNAYSTLMQETMIKSGRSTKTLILQQLPVSDLVSNHGRLAAMRPERISSRSR